jgi:hypothetical protein
MITKFARLEFELLRNSMAILVSNVLKLMVIERNQAYSPYKRVPFGYMAMCGLKKLFTKPFKSDFLLVHQLSHTVHF